MNLGSVRSRNGQHKYTAVIIVNGSKPEPCANRAHLFIVAEDRKLALTPALSPGLIIAHKSGPLFGQFRRDLPKFLRCFRWKEDAEAQFIPPKTAGNP